jgi:hypothetical protein
MEVVSQRRVPRRDWGRRDCDDWHPTRRRQKRLESLGRGARGRGRADAPNFGRRRRNPASRADRAIAVPPLGHVKKCAFHRQSEKTGRETPGRPRLTRTAAAQLALAGPGSGSVPLNSTVGRYADTSPLGPCAEISAVTGPASFSGSPERRLRPRAMSGSAPCEKASTPTAVALACWPDRDRAGRRPSGLARRASDAGCSCRA